jgi:hypothetical protein
VAIFRYAGGEREKATDFMLIVAESESLAYEAGTSREKKGTADQFRWHAFVGMQRRSYDRLT